MGFVELISSKGHGYPCVPNQLHRLRRPTVPRGRGVSSLQPRVVSRLSFGVTDREATSNKTTVTPETARPRSGCSATRLKINNR